MSKSVLVALSGGVDSSVCVKLLKEQGFAVSAVVMKMTDLHDKTVAAAQESADSLGVPLTVLDLRKEFEEKIISRFTEEYLRGHTPNPCVMCNPSVKFKYLTDEAERIGADYTATGHYARIVRDANGTAHLLRGESTARDQSYMLYRLTQRELSKLLLPLSEMEKPHVREIAAESKLSCATAPDSQENCFIADNDYAGYIRKRVGKLPTCEIIAPDGSVCATREGIIGFTVGQRKGLGVALGRPVFVSRISPEENRVYLADAQDVFCKEAQIYDVTSTQGKPFLQEFEAGVKIRSVAPIVKARLIPYEDGLKVVFAQPQRAVAPGQSMVLYDGDEVLGGGYIR